MAFVFPSTIRDLERIGDDSRLCARSPIDVAAATPSDLEELVKGVVFDLSDKELFCVEEQDVFDRVYSLVRDFSALPPDYKSSIFESLRSNLSVLLPNVDSLSPSSSSSVDHSFTDHVVRVPPQCLQNLHLFPSNYCCIGGAQFRYRYDHYEGCGEHPEEKLCEFMELGIPEGPPF